MSKRDDDGTSGVKFAPLAATKRDKASPNRGGRPVAKNSLRQQIARGDAKIIRLSVPVEVARILNLTAVTTERTVSQVVTDLVRANLTEVDG
jgi:hypothetical protein